MSTDGMASWLGLDGLPRKTAARAADAGAGAPAVGACPVCGGQNLSRLMEMPRFPLTGVYIDPGAPAPTFPTAFDNAWLFCDADAGGCGHGFLERAIDPVLLYEQTYSHRSSVSGIARAGNDVLWRFIQRVTHGKADFANALEIGCNDFYLTAKLRDIASQVVGVDPVWRANEPTIGFSNVTVLGKSLEEVEPWRDFQYKPDLMVSAHTMEHIAQPYEQLTKVVEHAADDALFIIEVPLMDAMVAGGRFDQVFHQHVQYFSYSSIARLINRLRCTPVAHEVNHRYWGGTIMVAFAKTSVGDIAVTNIHMSATGIYDRLAMFEGRCEEVLDEIDFNDFPVYAYGAAQMLPTLAYHMATNLYFIDGIIDDNPERIGKRYPAWPDVPIISPTSLTPEQWHDAGIWISAPDSARDLVRRAIRFEPRCIFPLMWRM